MANEHKRLSGPYGKSKNRADEYRKRAAKARAEAEKVHDDVVSGGIRQIADLWERLASHEDRKNASPPD